MFDNGRSEGMNECSTKNSKNYLLINLLGISSLLKR